MTSYKVELEDVQGWHDNIDAMEVLEATNGAMYSYDNALNKALKYIDNQDLFGGYSLYYKWKFSDAFKRAYNDKMKEA